MAQAKRVHSTPRKTASKIKCKPSEVSKVQKSGFDLVLSKKSRGKPATLDGITKIKWEPWRRKPDMRSTELIPSPETTDEIGVGCRIAYGVMLRTRPQLIAMHANVEHPEIADKPLAAGSTRWVFLLLFVRPDDLLAFPFRPRVSRCDRFRLLGKSSGPPLFTSPLDVEGDDTHIKLRIFE
jgi:hypothetical protein